MTLLPQISGPRDVPPALDRRRSNRQGCTPSLEVRVTGLRIAHHRDSTYDDRGSPLEHELEKPDEFCVMNGIAHEAPRGSGGPTPIERVLTLSHVQGTALTG
jgi:hypothetical protein